MEVDREKANGTENVHDMDSHASSFKALMDGIKALEQQSKSREQQLASKLEQERLKWEQEKQDLLVRLQLMQSPQKAPKSLCSPSRPILSALTPNKQHGPASNVSQATSESLFHDIFTSPAKSNNKITTPLSRPFSTNHGRSARSPNQIEAELQDVRKELKRVQCKYEVLYKAQGEILRKRNQDRDKWRHFKKVVKMASNGNATFQLELRKADASLKKQEEEAKITHSGKPRSTELILSPVNASSSPRTCLAAPGRASGSNTGMAAPLTIRTPTKVRQAAPTPPRLAKTSEFEPQSPNPPKPTCTQVRSSLGKDNTDLKSPRNPSFSLLQRRRRRVAAYDAKHAASPKSENADPLERELLRSRSEVNVTAAPLSEHEDANEELGEYARTQPNVQPDDEYLDWAASTALQEVLDENDAIEEAEISAVLLWEDENDAHTVYRICEEYNHYPSARSANLSQLQLDGKQTEASDVAPDKASGRTLHDRREHNQRPLASDSLPSTRDNVSCRPQEGDPAQRLIEPIPTEFDFGSYHPGTQNVRFATESARVALDQPAHPRDVSSTTSPVQYGRMKPKKDPAIESYVQPLSEPEADSNGVPRLYPLPQDLQSGVTPDQDVLEESVPIRRTKVLRLTELSDSPFASTVEDERIPKPFASHDGRGDETSVAYSSQTPRVSRSSSLAGLVVHSEEDEQAQCGKLSDNEATEASSPPALLDEENRAATILKGPLEVRNRNTPGNKSPDTSVDATTSTLRRRDPPVETALARTKPDGNLSPASKEGRQGDCSSVSDVDNASEEQLHKQADETDMTTTQELLRENRLASYRSSVLAAEHTRLVPKKISDGKIGPRRVTTAVKPVRKSEMSVTATNDFCHQYLARVTGKGASNSKQAHAPLGKPIAEATQLADKQGGTPSAWHNMRSKRRISGAEFANGSPLVSIDSRSFRRGLEGAGVSSLAVDIGPKPAQSIKTESHAGYAMNSVPSHARSTIRSTVSDGVVGKGEADTPPSSLTRLKAAEVASSARRLKSRKPRKSACLPDNEVVSDLETVASAIMQKTSFTLGSKRSATLQLLPHGNGSKKPRRDPDAYEQKANGTKRHNASGMKVSPNSRALGERNWVSQNGTEQQAFDQDSSTKSSGRGQEQGATSSENLGGVWESSASSSAKPTINIKAESLEDEGTSQESEEYQGQNFMRKLHDERKKAMHADPWKRKGRGAYAAQLQGIIDAADEARRPDVACKETIRGREARQAVHGIDCLCCSGYYEYKTRNLPLEERAKAAAEMTNDVSRHRQNWENAETPPGYWQMGFPSTLQVERLNEQAAKMKKDKRDREERQAANNSYSHCEVRRTFRVT